jgi:succinyl-diaminopimelate desuccinylase
MQDMLLDPVTLTQALIRQPTVTPCRDGAQAVLAEGLEAMGFAIRRMPLDGTDNLYARIGVEGPHLCFAGHTDVVPVGDAAAWTTDPFGAEIRGGMLHGRGAADMKSAIAAFASAAARFIGDHGPPRGSISFLITGDEEGDGANGTVRMLPLLFSSAGGAPDRPDACIVGEPTSEYLVGDVVKNGRRGSLNAVLTARGRQGHVAYPDKAANPVPVLLDALAALRAMPLDDGSPGFQPSRLEVTTVDVGNAPHNVIPAHASAKLNIRFNPTHAGADLDRRIRAALAGLARPSSVNLDVAIKVSGEAFYTPPGPLTDLLVDAVRAETGRTPRLTTDGGTSDARFIKDYCPVAELGLRNATAHQVDEHVAIDEIETLARTYYRVLAGFFRTA